MKYFDSHDAQTLLDLEHGGQLAGCRKLAQRTVVRQDDFCWGDRPAVVRPWAPTVGVSARSDALDAADLMTCYRG